MKNILGIKILQTTLNKKCDSYKIHLVQEFPEDHDSRLQLCEEMKAISDENNILPQNIIKWGYIFYKCGDCHN